MSDSIPERDSPSTARKIRDEQRPAPITGMADFKGHALPQLKGPPVDSGMPSPFDETTTTEPRCNATINPCGTATIVACHACGWADVAGNYAAAILKAEEHNATVYEWTELMEDPAKMDKNDEEHNAG